MTGQNKQFKPPYVQKQGSLSRLPVGAPLMVYGNVLAVPRGWKAPLTGSLERLPYTNRKPLGQGSFVLTRPLSQSQIFSVIRLRDRLKMLAELLDQFLA